jgi:hypothetical protein
MYLYKLLERVLGVALVVPPLYLLARFLRWSLQQERGTKETSE